MKPVFLVHGKKQNSKMNMNHNASTQTADSGFLGDCSESGEDLHRLLMHQMTISHSQHQQKQPSPYPSSTVTEAPSCSMDDDDSVPTAAAQSSSSSSCMNWTGAHSVGTMTSLKIMLPDEQIWIPLQHSQPVSESMDPSRQDREWILSESLPTTMASVAEERLRSTSYRPQPESSSVHCHYGRRSL